MKIVMLSWLPGAPVPPPRYGGIERMVGTLTAELVRQGHEVTLIAPPGSHIEGATVLETMTFHGAWGHVIQGDFDIVHDHSCWSLESPARRGFGGIPYVSTSHVMHSVGWTKNVVYLSKSQRAGHAQQESRDLSQSPVIRVPTNPALKPLGLPRKDYLLFLGAVQPHKGVTEAAWVAKKLGRELIVAGPAAGWYADAVKSMPNIQMEGEVGDPYRSQLIEQAYAMMCLHNDHGGWSEPGCGVVGEAGAFNTPVAALRNGCLPELVSNIVNGWIAETPEEVAELMQHYPWMGDAGHLARENWSAENIVKQYVSLYQEVIEGKTWE